jgi:hypothetical protein
MTQPPGYFAPLSLHDQACINLCGWIVAQIYTDPKTDLVLGQLNRVLPDVTTGHPAMGPLARAATDLLHANHTQGRVGIEYSFARLQLSAAVAEVFFIRAAMACERIWPEDAPQQEPAHAAE